MDLKPTRALSSYSCLRLAVAVSSTIMVPACAGDQEPRGESLGSTSQAVGNGEHDDANRFGNVGAMTPPGALQPPVCTAFLASRRFAISAAHCFLPYYDELKPLAGDRREANWDVVLVLV